MSHYEKVYEEIQVASGDYVDMKMYESGMRHLIDSYIRADDSEVITKFDDMSLVEVLIKEGISGIESLPEGIRTNNENVAEVIRSNIRRLIVDRQSVNPAYYDRMSDILNDLIEQAKQQVDDYEDYLKQLVELAKKVESPNLDSSYPDNINTPALAAIFDNTGTDEELALKIHKAILNSKKDGWKGHKIKEKIIRNAIKKVIPDDSELVDKVLSVAREQSEY